jgi:tetratricopeptide (TPR) repeat protein
VLFQIGSLRESKKQYLESLECYEKSLKLRIAAVGEDEVTADIVSRIGELHRIRGHYDLAMDKFTLALDMYKCAIGETHLSVANTYHSLGYVCDAMDDVPKSMQNHKEGLSVRKLILGANHVLIASSLDDIAGMYQKQNEHQKALKCLKEALRIRRLQLHDDDIEISKTLFGMGIIFAAINDNENATECYKTSLEISSRTGSHPKLEAQTLHQIGCLEAAKCNYREALHNWRTCLSKYRESGLRDDHYMVACTLGNIEMAENVLRT